MTMYAPKSKLPGWNAFLLILLLCTLVFGQKPAVVVGAVGADPKPGLRKAFETQIKAAFVKDGRFTAVTREEAVLAMLDSEQVYQRGGAVDDGQIRQIGAQSGARYVCVVEIAPLMDSYMMSAQFVDIESANIVNMASVPSALKNEGDFLAASAELVHRLLGTKPAENSKSGYGNGIFLAENKNANPISEILLKILKQKIPVSDGTCVGGVTVAIESATAGPVCAESMVGMVCKADVSLVITQCKGGKRSVLKGTVTGSDKTSVETAKRQFERSMETAKFWGEWTKELEKWAK
ncbi:MAG: hypothetical protein FWB94_06790 [Chitinispirillia bacterium]|nr:hypothetical protein [Chitinispirillia bacterium]